MLKTKVLSVLVASSLLLAACGDNKVIDGKEYGTYGLLNADTARNPNVEYQPIVGNIVWTILLFESIVFPIYFLGFSIMEPVGKKGPDFEPGVVR